jgi:hypothetical protein
MPKRRGKSNWRAHRGADPIYSGFHKGKGDASYVERHDSVCFSFDSAYNNWQCFVYRDDTKRITRWGYHATADCKVWRAPFSAFCTLRCHMQMGSIQFA